MNSQSKNDNFWICRLGPANIADWNSGFLDHKAKALGINGWIVPLMIDREANLIKSVWNHQNHCLLAAPWINVQHPLSPTQEIKLASQLKTWWNNKTTLKIMGQRFLVLSGIKNLSHTVFSLKRLKLSFPNTLIVGEEDEWISQQNQDSIDLIIQSNLKGSKNKPVNYLQNLRKAHHEMNPHRLWIPAVNGLTPEEEPLWRNASAKHYCQWLLQSSAWSRIRYLEHREAPLFINSWSSHQRWWNPESEKKSVHICHQAQLPRDQVVTHSWGKRERGNIAIMIHGYYLDRLINILNMMSRRDRNNGVPDLDLYVSTPYSQFEKVKNILINQSWSRVYLCGVSNRGRDIAPFILNLLPEALRTGHHSFVKLHTKKSPHLKGGIDWSDHLVNSLLNKKFLSKLNDNIENEPHLGLFAPAGTLLNSSVGLGYNVDHLQLLLRKTRWNSAWALSQNYIAGSMMSGRLSTMKALEDLELSIDDFEPEQGQTDGTLAHALERLISWQYANQDLTIKTIPSESPSVPQFGFGWV